MPHPETAARNRATLYHLAAFNFATILIAAIRCKNGRPVRYPLTIRFFS